MEREEDPERQNLQCHQTYDVGPMITIAYDNRYGTLYRLLFAGLNAKGNPQWVSLTPGEIMKNESKWMEVRVDEFYHLCKEGEEVPSYLVARLLGMTFDHKSYRGRAMKNLLSKMKDLNLKWKKDPLELVFTIYDESEEDKESYLLRVDEDKHLTMVDETEFESLHDVEFAISTYMYVLRHYTEIPVTKMKLRAPKKLITSWKKGRLLAFTDYSAFENEPEY